MKNTISIASNYVCTCVDSIADNTNRIFVSVNVGNASNPKFKIWKNGNLHSTTTLTANEINNVEIPAGIFEANAVITFQYLDDEYTGEVFTVSFPSELNGNLKIVEVSDYVYNAKYTAQSDDTGWLNLTLNSGWSSPYMSDVAQYRRIGKVVYLRGLINATAAAGPNIATLPEGYRPSGQFQRYISCVNQSDNVALQIKQNGVLSDQTKTTSAGREFISLYNVAFLVD